MSEHKAQVIWQRGNQPFLDNKYARRHDWYFDGGLIVPGSSSPHVVPEPCSDGTAVDPEEAFVAALSSCHMLWFLDLARRSGLIVDAYQDDAVGFMTKNETGRYWIETVVLSPKIKWSGKSPVIEKIRDLHDQAHSHCFLANSVRTTVITKIE